MDNPDRSAAYRVQLPVVLAGLTMIGILAAATGSAEASPTKTFLISPTSFDFGDVPVGTTSAQQAVTITNVSGVPVVPSIGGGAAGLFGGSHDCPGSLNPGQSCHIFYAFSPTALGPVTGSTSGSFNGQSFSFTFAGNGIRRFLISPTSFDFGDVLVRSTSAQQAVTITNVSNAPVVPSIGGGAAGLFGGSHDCPGSLNPGESCHIFYAFSPTALGPVTGSTSGSFNGQGFSFTFAGNGYNRAGISDLDADGRTDPAVYRPSTGEWFFLRSSTNYTTSTVIGWGVSTDRPVPGDYDGDGKIDLAVFRPSTGDWIVLMSSTNYTTSSSTQWGNSADKPVPGDYDGDGKTDIAVYRPSSGTWFIIKSSSGTITGQWGNSTDVPVPGDYDGDGKTDMAVYRPSIGTWFIIKSSSGATVGIQWGNSTDLTVQADYDGDGKTDMAVYRPSNGMWFIIKSSSGAPLGVQWGNSTDVPIPADYDGDGKTDLATFRPSSGTWFIVNSGSGTPVSFPFGVGSDIPIPETYLGRWVP